MSLDEMWATASRDADAERLERVLTQARLAATPVWPFLAAAVSKRDYGHRKALAADRIERVAATAAGGDPVLFGVVHTSLLSQFDADFEVIHAARKAEDALRQRVEAENQRRAAKQASAEEALERLRSSTDKGALERTRDQNNRLLQQILPPGTAEEIKEQNRVIDERLKSLGSKVAADGQTCSVCGDKIAQDADGSYHHDNGEKHDHAAEPGGKESARKMASEEYAFEVAGVGEAVWSRNSATYPSKAEAEAAGRSLLQRWFGADMLRVVPVSTPQRQSVDPQDSAIVINYRTAARKTAEQACPVCGAGTYRHYSPDGQAVLVCTNCVWDSFNRAGEPGGKTMDQWGNFASRRATRKTAKQYGVYDWDDSLKTPKMVAGPFDTREEAEQHVPEGTRDNGLPRYQVNEVPGEDTRSETDKSASRKTAATEVDPMSLQVGDVLVDGFGKRTTVTKAPQDKGFIINIDVAQEDGTPGLKQVRPGDKVWKASSRKTAAWSCPKCASTQAHTRKGKTLTAALAANEPVKCGSCGEVTKTADTASTDDLYTFNDGGASNRIPEDVLRQIQDRDPDGGSVQPTDADYAEFRDWVERLFPEYADAYFGTTAARREARRRKLACDRCGHEWQSRAQYRIKCPNCGAESSIRYATRKEAITSGHKQAQAEWLTWVVDPFNPCPQCGEETTRTRTDADAIMTQAHCPKCAWMQTTYNHA